MLKKSYIYVLLFVSLLALTASTVTAATALQFNTNLAWGVNNTDEVSKLQLFLQDQGLYSGPITGKFLSQTYQAVRQFQSVNNINPVSGYFGSATRAVANRILLAEQNGGTAQVSSPNSATVIMSLKTQVSSLYDQVRSLQNTLNNGPVTAQASTLPPVKPVTSQTTGPVTSQTSQPVQPITQPTQTTTPPAPVTTGMQWGAYVGNNVSDVSTFESLVGKPVNIVSVFYGFTDSFPMEYSSVVGQKGKTLLIFWEPSTGLDQINNGSQDSQITAFAKDAKTYGYPVILAPFHEMNGNWDVWDGTVGNNSPAKFIQAWKHVHDIFVSVGAKNVSFALVYNSDSVPDVSGNQFADYYPGSSYVDYVGVDGFNSGDPWQSFTSIFSSALTQLETYNKPLYIFSTASVPGSQKAAWISDALGVQVKKYPIKGWVWFNQNGQDGDWLVNSDAASLASFKSIIP